MSEVVVIGIIVFILLIYVISKRNKFVELKNAVNEQMSNISTYREQRSVYLNDALGIVGVSYKNEAEILNKLDGNNQYNELLALGQKYPNLQSIQGYNVALENVSICNKEIAACKSALNANIREYNNSISMFPGVLVAKLFGFKKETYIDEENMKNNKQVKVDDIDFDKY